MDTLKELGFEVTYSAPCPVASYGKAHWVFTKNPVTGRQANGYGDDEASAIADAVATITRPEPEPPVKPFR